MSTMDGIAVETHGFQHFEVTVDMAEPIVHLDDLIHLDGPLAFGAFMALPAAEKRIMPPLSSPWAIDIPVPLAKWYVPVDSEKWPHDDRLLDDFDVDGVVKPCIWGWCATSQLDPWDGRGTIEYRKKPALERMARYSGAKKVNVGAGRLKAYDVKFPTVLCRQVRWRAFGDMSKCLTLLEYVSAVGKKRNTGNGRVLRWHAMLVEGHWSPVVGTSPMRRLPVLSGIVGRPGTGSIRPPYHHRSRRVQSVEPI
jgi:hypothetical protein